VQLQRQKTDSTIMAQRSQRWAAGFGPESQSSAQGARQIDNFASIWRARRIADGGFFVSQFFCFSEPSAASMVTLAPRTMVKRISRQHGLRCWITFRRRAATVPVMENCFQQYLGGDLHHAAKPRPQFVSGYVPQSGQAKRRRGLRRPGTIEGRGNIVRVFDQKTQGIGNRPARRMRRSCAAFAW